MVCAITGASGYVGSRLADYLARRLDVVPISRRPVPKGIQWEMGQGGDISRELRVRMVTFLVHAAWDFGHPNAKDNERVNVEGSQRLFESADKAGVERIIFISTISSFREARSMYGQSKLRAEDIALAKGGIVIRPGLVWGDGLGGMFGSLAAQVAQKSLIPLIGSGRYPQYLVHEADLAEAVLRAASGEWKCDAAVTLAHPQPWLLRDLVHTIAESQGRKVRLLPVPWPAVYGALKTAELMGARMGFRSDSVLSLVFQDPAPDFTLADQLGLKRRAYQPAGSIRRST
jgi:nucleoside-diphosphate-sugar epimerase